MGRILFVILKENVSPPSDLEETLKSFVCDQIGAIARPKQIIFTPELPKTRSGKIMRRILRCIAENEPVGDTMTLANPEIVEGIQSLLS